MKTASKYVQKNEQVSTFFFTDADKILSDFYGKRFSDYRKKWYGIENEFMSVEYPLHLDIEVSNKCNYKCAICTFSINESDKDLPPFMDTDIFKKIIDESAEHGLPAIQTSYFGEPLMRKDLHDLVAYARKKGIMDVFVTTNGALLTETRAKELIDAGVSRIHISVDAYSRESYDLIRRKGYFDIVLNNIHNLIKMKGANKLPIVRVSFCKNAINEHETDSFIDYWRKHGADQVAIQEYINAEPGKANLFPKDRHTVNDFVCLDPFRRLSIRSNGDILPCCIIYGSSMKLGNVATDSIYDVWRSKKICDLRKMIKERKYHDNPYCSVCVKNSTGG
jgi:radical SAM protein with 4Fe4S-binding SPASM domain